MSALVRRHLVTGDVGGKAVERIEVREIVFAGYQKTGVHLHPCPVVGYIAEGTFLFQIDGQAPRTLKAGDAVYEPPNTKIVHFDNATDAPAKLIASYLLGKGESELIRILE